MQDAKPKAVDVERRLEGERVGVNSRYERSRGSRSDLLQPPNSPPIDAMDPLVKVGIEFSKFSKSIKPLTAVKLPGITKPSCLKFVPQCPINTSSTEAWFVVGSYFLVPDEPSDDERFNGTAETGNGNGNAQGKRLQKKLGCLQLFCINPSTGGEL